ncbi:class I SAM-dependent methyltransferase [Halonotius terrestris]|uniref:Class I SAM-dependent methyltransferase n=1 Tax=Halonotius terrestris TaxID=2487750 RepID=A0A8J8TAW2_9EURY|nr:class I SAM-dependent methyltransferase [Halonotius terrestris]TQQ79803.1 class I SAM-dependent methyltransferase [Halonotius terrestris]
MIDREAVRSNAKYLRQVRPIDPDEICEYIEGQPHPAVVRQTLREEAFDLGLVERDDGAFVPVAEGPAAHREWAPDSFPNRYSMTLEDLLVERYGANWHRGESGRNLRTAIRELKADYLDREAVEYDDRTAAGYAVYHLPAYYATVGYVLATLTERGLLPRTLRVLDVGAGAGGPALGLHDFLFGVDGDSDDGDSDSDDGDSYIDDGDSYIDELAASVDYHAVEPSGAADVLDRLLDETARNFRPTIHRTTIEEFDYDSVESSSNDGDTDDSGTFDLILFGNVLNELDDPESVLDTALDQLAPDGSIIAFEPADLNTATGLRETERAVADDGDVTIYAPTLRLWPDETPSDRGWSFDVRPDLEAPPFQNRLAEGHEASEADVEPDAYRNTDVQFAYSILRTDGERRYPFQASRDRHAKMADMDDHVTERIDLLAVKLSHDLSDGDNSLYHIGDGSQATDHYAVLTKESGLNRDLAAAPYGAVLSFENVLTLWNDDEAAYNLVVDAETVVESLTGR